jgi:uncharacterized protein (TIGR00661 family)
MKYFFIVQGEGMGHTTQSLALRAMLERNGHSVDTTIIGTNFFRGDKSLYQDIRHERFFSPVFLRRSDKKGIELFRTFLYNLLLTPVYLYEIFRIAYRIRTSEAQAVIVFYDMVGQLASFFSFSGKPVYSVSHHFFFSHKAFQWPATRRTERGLLLLHNWFASVGSRKILALSFSQEENTRSEKILVVPPLIREEILNSVSISGDHIHVYCLQPGFLQSVINLAKLNPEKNFRVFLHNTDKNIELPGNVNVSPVSGVKFRESLVSSALVICNAGFETPCEAIYLNKPLIIVPSFGHFEQYCNSVDAERINAAIVWKSFDNTELPVLKNNPANAPFDKWVKQCEEIIMNCIVQ